MKTLVLKFASITAELCPYCEEEVKIIHSIEKCPKCKKIISACSMCDLKGCKGCKKGSHFVINPLIEEDVIETKIELKTYKKK